MLLALHLNGLNLDSATAVAVVSPSGTLSGSSEADVVAGGRTIVLTLTNDTWVAAGTGPVGSTANTQALIDGIDSSQTEPNGWDAQRSNILTSNVVRTSDTVVTITLPALSAYSISADETLTATIPAATLTGAVQLIALNAISILADTVDIGLSLVNSNATTNVPVNYEICDRTGFRVKAGTLVKDGYGGMVRPESYEGRHPLDMIRSKPEKQRGSPRPEGTDQFLDDLYPSGVGPDDL